MLVNETTTAVPICRWAQRFYFEVISVEFKYYLMQQLEKHKSMQPRDIVKMCYQAAFGAEHLLADNEAAKKYFYTEYNLVDAVEGELYEEISQDVSRADLRAWKASGMPAEWLFNMFVDSAGVLQGSKEMFLGYIKEAEEVLQSEKVAFTPDEWKGFLTEYQEGGITAVHHSEIYHESEKPAYRIINNKFLKVFQILKKAALLPEKKSVKIIAIDGRAAAGKTTMAELLRVALGAEIIHMDDFFLPPKLRCEARFAEPGGNVHYERFQEEVLPNIANAEDFTYRIFDCSRMDYNGERQVGASAWRIVEGSYSHHPKFGDYADIKVFLDVEPDEQMRRIVTRNGEDMAKIFQSKWIPMEEAYFEKYCSLPQKFEIFLTT